MFITQVKKSIFRLATAYGKHIKQAQYVNLCFSSLPLNNMICNFYHSAQYYSSKFSIHLPMRKKYNSHIDKINSINLLQIYYVPLPEETQCAISNLFKHFIAFYEGI